MAMMQRGAPKHVGQEQRACDDLGGALAHQHVVAADVRLAFGAVDDQRLARERASRACRPSDRRRRPSPTMPPARMAARCAAASAGHAGACVGGHALVAAVGLDDDARRRLHAVAAEHGALLDRAHPARARRHARPPTAPPPRLRRRAGLSARVRRLRRRLRPGCRGAGAARARAVVGTKPRRIGVVVEAASCCAGSRMPPLRCRSKT